MVMFKFPMYTRIATKLKQQKRNRVLTQKHWFVRFAFRLLDGSGQRITAWLLIRPPVGVPPHVVQKSVVIIVVEAAAKN